jgi:hypothetical protein
MVLMAGGTILFLWAVFRFFLLGPQKPPRNIT